MYRLWTPAFLTEPVEETGCYTTEEEWTRIHARFPGAKRIFARCTVGDKEVICALGHPLRGLEEFTREVPPLVIPMWFHSYLSIEEGSATYSIEWMTEEFFPEATKIVLRPHDSAFYHVDAKEELEAALTRYGVLQKGITIPVRLSELGGFDVMFDSVGLEPANIVLMEGEEVAIEFEEALDAVPEPSAPPTGYVTPPRPPRTPTLFPSPPEIVRTVMPFSDEMLPAPLALAEPVGERLGGTSRPPRADGRPWNPWRQA